MRTLNNTEWGGGAGSHTQRPANFRDYSEKLQDLGLLRIGSRCASRRIVKVFCPHTHKKEEKKRLLAHDAKQNFEDFETSLFSVGVNAPNNVC